MLVERLAFEERSLERVAQGADGIGEHMVEHRRRYGGLDGGANRLAMALLVIVDAAEGVGTLTLDNPWERNTLTGPMVAEIVAAMEAIEATTRSGPWW